jgi:hypothetical protein
MVGDDGAKSKRLAGRVRAGGAQVQKFPGYDGPWTARAAIGKVRGDCATAKSHRGRALGNGRPQIVVAVLEGYFTSSHRLALFAFR